MTAAAASPRASWARRGLWWTADYLYAARRQLAVVSPPWSFGRPRPTPAAWSRGTGVEVVLVPGVYEHWTFLRPLADALSAAGHRVLVIHGLGMNRRTISSTAERLASVLAEHAGPGGRVIVAHSKGGLIGKQVLVSPDAASLDLLGLVAVATPFGGSRLARLFFVPSIRAFDPHDETILSLGRASSVNGRIVSIFGPYDPHIPEGSALDGATNVLVPTAGHFRVLGAHSTHAAVIEAVARLQATATD